VTSTLRTPGFKDFVPELQDRLQRMTDLFLEEFDEHTAFDYLVADLFETTNDERFRFTDGPKDGGVDFFIQNFQSYSIYQCKCPAIETLERARVATTFDKNAVMELISAVRFLQDRESRPDFKPEVLRLRTDYQRDLDADSESTSLTAALAVMGELTPAAQELFETEKRKLRGEQVILKLITWKDIYRSLHEEPQTDDFSMYLHYDDFEKDILTRKDYFYMLAQATDLYEAWRAYEWQLFDWNVRFQLHKSPINERIVNSLVKTRTRKIFHHLNNGILIVCNSYRNDRNQKRIRLAHPQIINGCQTVTAIRDAYESLDPKEQEDFRNQTFIQVKVIMSAADYVEDLVITTNDQNPMNPRNLKSNSAEQKDLQTQFRQFPGGNWFYERKDGEWKSLEQTSHQVRWFRKSEYATSGRGRPRFRKIDNEQLARSWYAWIGYSESVLKGGLEYFTHQAGIYARIFKSRPNERFWSEFSSNPYFSPSDEHFEAGVASMYEYLLACTVAQYVDAMRIGWQKCKQEAIQRGLEQGDLRRIPLTSSCRESCDQRPSASFCGDGGRGSLP